MPDGVPLFDFLGCNTEKECSFSDWSQNISQRCQFLWWSFQSFLRTTFAGVSLVHFRYPSDIFACEKVNLQLQASKGCIILCSCICSILTMVLLSFSGETMFGCKGSFPHARRSKTSGKSNFYISCTLCPVTMQNINRICHGWSHLYLKRKFWWCQDSHGVFRIRLFNKAMASRDWFLVPAWLQPSFLSTHRLFGVNKEDRHPFWQESQLSLPKVSRKVTPVKLRVLVVPGLDLWSGSKWSVNVKS